MTAANDPFAWVPINPALDKLLKEAAGRTLTPAEVFEQRVSWCYGMQKLFNDKVLTKDQIRSMLREHDESSALKPTSNVGKAGS